VTPNERVVATAARYIGVREKNGTNDDGGGPITKWEAFWNLRYEPWCGMFASGILREAGVTDVSNPGTSVICEQGRAKGWTTSTPVPGALVVWCGRHVEILVSCVRPGVWNTIGGNTGDMVARRVRSLAGATIVVSPELRENKPAKHRAYYLEDTAVKPTLYGPWRLKSTRDKKMAALRPALKAHARPVRIGKRYAFTIGRRVYGPWLDTASRDASRTVLEARLGRTLRPFSRLV